MREIAKGRVDRAQDVEHRRQAVVDRGRHGVELREVGVAGLQGGVRQPHAEDARVALEGDGSDQNTAKTEQAGLRERAHHVAREPLGRRQSRFPDEGRDQLTPGFEVAFDRLEALDAVRDLRVVLGTDVAALDAVRSGQVEVPVGAAIDRHGHEAARDRKSASNAPSRLRWHSSA